MQQAFGEFVICGGLSDPRFRRGGNPQMTVATETEFDIKTMDASTEINENHFKSTKPKGTK